MKISKTEPGSIFQHAVHAGGPLDPADDSFSGQCLLKGWQSTK